MKPAGYRLIVVVYAILALAATGRSTYEILTKFDQAPVPYALSGFAAIVYVLATISFAAGWRNCAICAATIELIGVLGVGAVSVLVPGVFPATTVWSNFGMGYLFVPLVLPMIGLWWARERMA